MLNLVVLLLLAAGAVDTGDAPAYRVLKKIPVGGEGGWDYLIVDPANRRLYITRSNRVMVLDADSGKTVGEVTGCAGVHGVALVPALNRGFISNGGDATVTVFDLQTLRETDRIKVGQRPDAIIFDPASQRVFTFNAGSHDATAVDVNSLKVVGKVRLGGQPEFAAADGKGTVFVNIEDKSELVAFDARNLEVKARWKLDPGKAPAGLAFDPAQRRLFATCHNQKMVVLDADSGKVLASPEIGKGTDACAFDPGTGCAFSSNGDGTLTVVQADGADGYRVAANVKTQAGARTMALDTKTHHIFLVTARPKAAQAGAQGGDRRRGFEPGSFVVLVVGSE